MCLKGKPNSMLIVDDDEMNCDILSAIFGDKHEILTAANGQEGLDVFNAHKAQTCAILLDVEMPVMNGMEMLEKLAQAEVPSTIPVFLITGTEEQISAQAYDMGVMDVISKPFSPPVVQRRVHSVMELFAARNHFKEVVDLQTVELRKQNAKLADLNMGMVEALATATEFRSAESGEHVRRIHDITYIFLTQSPLHEKFSQQEISYISQAAILHDVGKISIPDSILNKPGRFTNEEFAIMKAHTVNGDQMLTQIPKLRQLPFYEHARTIARSHHERWDGRGYPDHLEGDAIPLSAQIVSIADVYDALVSARVYKPSFSHDQAVQMILDGQCGVFNPALVQYFSDIAPAITQLYSQPPADDKLVEQNGRS